MNYKFLLLKYCFVFKYIILSTN